MMFRNILSLAVQGTLRKRRSSILLFSVLLTSFSFAVAALSLVGSISKTNAEFRLNTYGEWYCAIPSGMEADEAWLNGQPWAGTVGRADNYGTIRTDVGQAGFGTLDDDLVRIGRIRLDQGRFPAADDEIAMEADVLSALGYEYKLGQEIRLLVDVPCQDQFVTVERRYTLCGILHEYSGLWVLNRNSDHRLLVSAVVTRAAAESVRSAAADSMTEPPAAPIAQYFLTVDEADRETACAAINSWLSSTRTDEFGDIRVSQNTAAYPNAASKEYDAFYVHLIAVVTMIAVLCVYITQMSREIHSFAILRSIGITRLQMALLVLAETLLLLLPAVALGIPCGAGLTWLALRLMLYSGSVAIQVAIPYGTLLAAMQTGQQWDKYIAGEEFGYDRVYVGVDLNSDYLSTDIAMAALCSGNALKLDNRRQEFHARVQENVQTLILLYSAGICIALVALLILSSALSLEAEQERRRFGILRAIGMSRRQMRRRRSAKALMRSLTAAVIGWGLYIGYCMIWLRTGFPIDRTNYADALLLTGICLLVPFIISLPSWKGGSES